MVYLCRYKEGRFPEHMETMTVKNTSPLDADISFCYLHDSKGETFLLDPPTMMLKPGDQSVSAQTRNLGFFVACKLTIDEIKIQWNS